MSCSRRAPTAWHEPEMQGRPDAADNRISARQVSIYLKVSLLRTSMVCSVVRTSQPLPVPNGPIPARDRAQHRGVRPSGEAPALGWRVFRRSRHSFLQRVLCVWRTSMAASVIPQAKKSRFSSSRKANTRSSGWPSWPSWPMRAAEPPGGQEREPQSTRAETG